MIELSEPLQKALEGQREPLPVFDPRTNTTYFLVRADMYEHLQSLAYDDSPWTDEEKAMLAAESGRSIGWDAMDEYDDYDRNRT